MALKYFLSALAVAGFCAAKVAIRKSEVVERTGVPSISNCQKLRLEIGVGRLRKAGLAASGNRSQMPLRMPM